MIKAIKMGGFLVGLLLLAACVTINIYFPAAQAEQAAEKIVDEIIGNPAAVEDKGAALDARQYSRIGFNLLEMLVRAYDPCISCSVHMLDVDFIE